MGESAQSKRSGRPGLTRDRRLRGQPPHRERPEQEPAGFISRATRVRREVGIPVATSWDLGVPQTTDTVIRQELIDIAMIGRPALSTPGCPVWAGRELGHEAPFDLVPADWRWWLSNFRGHAPSIGLPLTPAEIRAAAEADVPIAEFGEVPVSA